MPQLPGPTGRLSPEGPALLAELTEKAFVRRGCFAERRQPYSEGRIWRSRVTLSSIGGWVENRPASPFALKGLTM